MINKNLLLFCLLLSCSFVMEAQNVGIGTNNPHHKAIVHLEDSTRGFLPTRMTSAQRDTLTLKPEGLVIYNITTHCLEFWNGSQWISSCASTAPCMAPPAPAVSSNSPICAGQTLNLTASPISGATYIWTGPNGFYSTNQNPSIPNANTSHSGTYCCKVYVAGCYSTDACVNVNILSPPGIWTQKSSFNGSPKRHTGAYFALGDTIFVINGRRSDMACCVAADGCYAYKIGTNTWFSINCPGYCSNPGRVSHHYGYAYGGYGYVAGGGDNPCSSFLNQIWRYDRATNTWALQTFTLPYQMYAAQPHGQKIGNFFYIFGGNKWGCPEMLNTILRFDTTTSVWSNIGTYTTNSSKHAGGMFVLPLGSYIYFGGGGYWSCPQGCCGALTDWYKYDPSTNTTQPMSTPLPTTLSYQSFVIGGYGYVPKKEGSDIVLYRLDPSTETWSKICTPMKDYPEVTIVVNDKVYLIDTNDDSGDNVYEHYEWQP